MSRAYGITQHDYGKPVIGSFSYDNPALGSLSDLITLATPVTATVKSRTDGTILVNKRAAQVVSSSGGTVVLRFNWQAGDTATIGRYSLTWEATTIGGTVTLPTSGEVVPVTIRADLDAA